MTQIDKSYCHGVISGFLAAHHAPALVHASLQSLMTLIEQENTVSGNSDDLLVKAFNDRFEIIPEEAAPMEQQAPIPAAGAGEPDEDVPPPSPPLAQESVAAAPSIRDFVEKTLDEAEKARRWRTDGKDVPPVMFDGEKPTRKQRAPQKGGWSDEDKDTLRSMYSRGENAAYIAQELGRPRPAVTAMIHYEIKAGRLQKQGKRATEQEVETEKPAREHWNRMEHIHHTSVNHAHPIDEYEENGITVRKFAPGYAGGVWPQKNIKQG